MADEMTQEDIDALLSGGGLGAETEARLGPAQPVALAALAADAPPADPASINMLYDVELEVKIELGRTMLSVEDILRLREGSIIQLDKDAGAPVDILHQQPPGGGGRSSRSKRLLLRPRHQHSVEQGPRHQQGFELSFSSARPSIRKRPPFGGRFLMERYIIAQPSVTCLRENGFRNGSITCPQTRPIPIPSHRLRPF